MLVYYININIDKKKLNSKYKYIYYNNNYQLATYIKLNKHCA